MSAAEIMRELPRLTREQRSAVSQRLRDLEEQDGSLFLQEAAESMFEEMDNEELPHAHRKAR